MSASTFAMVILCMTMSIMRRSSACHFWRADLETLLAFPAAATLPRPAGLRWNFFLLLKKRWWNRWERNRQKSNQCLFMHSCTHPKPSYPITLVPSMLPSLSATYPNTLFLLFHCLTSPLTVLPVSGSELLAVVLADNSAPESVTGGVGFQRATRPPTRSDMGLARRRRAVTSCVFLRSTSSCWRFWDSSARIWYWGAGERHINSPVICFLLMRPFFLLLLDFLSRNWHLQAYKLLGLKWI